MVPGSNSLPQMDRFLGMGTTPHDAAVTFLLTEASADVTLACGKG